MKTEKQPVIAIPIAPMVNIVLMVSVKNFASPIALAWSAVMMGAAVHAEVALPGKIVTRVLAIKTQMTMAL